jgi:5-formyltetrahydrofolate cyclo-ligase
MDEARTPLGGDDKRTLRARLVARRAQLDAVTRQALSRAVVERLEASPALAGARTVALYAPLGAEVELGGLAGRLGGRGVRVVYPRIQEGDRRLTFAICPAEALVRGPFSALEPPAGAPEIPHAEVGCVLVPAVAFSEDGLRLGRGGGFYDATLSTMPAAVRVGLAFDFQIVPRLPREAHDVPMDAVFTERRALLFERPAP